MQLQEMMELLSQSVAAHLEVYQNFDLLKHLFQSQISVAPPRSFLGASHTECIVFFFIPALSLQLRTAVSSKCRF